MQVTPPPQQRLALVLYFQKTHTYTLSLFLPFSIFILSLSLFSLVLFSLYLHLGRRVSLTIYVLELHQQRSFSPQVVAGSDCEPNEFCNRKNGSCYWKDEEACNGSSFSYGCSGKECACCVTGAWLPPRLSCPPFSDKRSLKPSKSHVVSPFLTTAVLTPRPDSVHREELLREEERNLHPQDPELQRRSPPGRLPVGHLPLLRGE